MRPAVLLPAGDIGDEQPGPHYIGETGAKPFEPKPCKNRKKQNALTFEAAGPLFKALGVDLTEIEGIGRLINRVVAR